MISTQEIKNQAKSLEADLCGIASIDRFSTLPDISNPAKILPNSNSVIVIAKHFLDSTIESTSSIPYTIIRNYLSREIDHITISLSYYIEKSGYSAIPTGAIEPCNWDSKIFKSMGLISLKNAAVQAGLGVVGKNTLLITPEYGNMIWLGAIITTAKLDPDTILENKICKDSCTLCISNCPVEAIKGDIFMDQIKCWNYAFGKDNGGEWRIKCFKCRTICPYSKGFEL
jgi:epoxyqueuosine reductase